MSEAYENGKKPRYSLVDAFRFAGAGLLRTLCTQRNMKIHWVSGAAVALVGMALEMDIAARASIMFCVFLVLGLEVLNTALEAFVDLHVKEFARTAMIAKDAAAAAVLIVAIGAVVIFADILLHRWAMILRSGEYIFNTVVAGVPLLALMAGILFSRRNVFRTIAFGIAATLLLSFLAYRSRDEVFSLCALAFIFGAMAARILEPKLLAGISVRPTVRPTEDIPPEARS